jgi:HEPN domain-containing protein
MVQNQPKYSEDDETWLQWGDVTYTGAHTLFHSDDVSLWFPAAILGHQALEMYLKAALILRGHRVVRTDILGHDLRQLASKLSAKGCALPLNLLEKLDVFTNYFNELRYPVELVKVKGLGEAERDLLDELVSVLRPMAQCKPNVL